MNVVGAFLKEPQPGKVKTRLVADGLDQDFVLDLYNAFTNDSLNLIQSVSAEKKWAFIAPGASSDFIQSIEQKNFESFEQQGDDLGQRMFHYFQTAFENGAQKVVLIGTDSPSLPLSFLEEAFTSLDQNQVVLGPSNDGGYYLIGLSSFVPDIFENVAWSSEQVLEQTLDCLEKSEKLSVTHLLPMWYDIDQKSDLLLLKYHLKSLHSKSSFLFPACSYNVLFETNFF